MRGRRLEIVGLGGIVSQARKTQVPRTGFSGCFLVCGTLPAPLPALGPAAPHTLLLCPFHPEQLSPGTGQRAHFPSQTVLP